MSKNLKKYFLAISIAVMAFMLSGCTVLEDIEKKLGLKNEYFEYLNSNKVEQISIHSTRDTGFKFIVTEDSAIKEMYKFLLRAKISENKSNLEPDYKFEIDLGDEVKEFYYVVGSDEGNFYDGNNIFTVSKRLDEGIIKNLSFIRKPRDFEYVYYNSILDVLKISKENSDIENYKVGVDINGDIECLKYIFSTDLKDFLQSAKKVIPNIELIDDDSTDYDVVVTVKNRGYDTSTYKTLITITNKKENTEDNYYIFATNEFKEWTIDITEKAPNKW